MSNELRKGFMWGFGLSLSVSVVVAAWFVVGSYIENRERPKWSYERQENMEIVSHSSQIVEVSQHKNILSVSGDISGTPNPAREGAENDILVGAIIRNPAGVFLSACSTSIPYSSYLDLGVRWFRAECEPPASEEGIGRVDFQIEHAWREE